MASFTQISSSCVSNPPFGANSTLGIDSSDSKGNEPVPESGVERGKKSGSDSDSGAGIKPPLVLVY